MAAPLSPALNEGVQGGGGGGGGCEGWWGVTGSPCDADEGMHGNKPCDAAREGVRTHNSSI